ncbi:MAG: DUF423 domain-containing protein, partial [Pirellulaceae bacterium]|nr:DUF423 domain-containing protein [Pirellulaceae bacterium]
MATCKKCLVIGAVSMAMAIGCGAFGAHALKSMLLEDVKAGEITDIERLDTSHSWDVAVRNHGIHSLGLVGLGLATSLCSPALLRWGRRLLLAGIVLFCGLIYIYTAVKVTSGTALTLLMFLVPLGGGSLILAWILLAVGFYCGPAVNNELD